MRAVRKAQREQAGANLQAGSCRLVQDVVQVCLHFASMQLPVGGEPKRTGVGARPGAHLRRHDSLHPLSWRTVMGLAVGKVPSTASPWGRMRRSGVLGTAYSRLNLSGKWISMLGRRGILRRARMTGTVRHLYRPACPEAMGTSVSGEDPCNERVPPE